MPNCDGGHYFLTALSPILADPMTRADGGICSPTASLREALASLPTAMQSEAAAAAGHESPFSRCHRTHFARLVVIDQPAFNGRDPGNALIESIRKTDLLVGQPIDRLTRAWLLLILDFDPGEGADDGRAAYLTDLWDLMAPELRDIYRHCHGFDRATDGAGFARYIARCQVETTMPFNDYWTTPPPLPAITMGAIVSIALAIAALGTLAAWGGTRLAHISAWWTLAGVPLALALGIFIAYRVVHARGSRLFPTAPNSDLRSVLKALHLQQNFARFAIAQQGASPAALQAAFAGFVETYRPADVTAPTQAPGVVRS